MLNVMNAIAAARTRTLHRGGTEGAESRVFLIKDHSDSAYSASLR
jgi:hypothetical protein